MADPRHLPATRAEMTARGWDELDVILVTGDAHVDHPSFPAALLGRWLETHGFRVGVIARPASQDPEAVTALGRPRLFFGVTAGALDSLVANYTAQKKPRSDDAFAPGGRAGGRPDRALTAYCNLVRRAFGKSVFVVAGGLEASLRRFAHYDFWSDRVRRPILMDCGADILVHGMGEGPLLEIARRLERLGRPTENDADLAARRLAELRDVPGVVFREPKRLPPPSDGIALPSAEDVAADPVTHARAWQMHEKHRRLRQWQETAGMRVVANAPWPPLTTAELDRLYEIPFTRDAHPMYGKLPVPALEQVRFSLVSHRGCVGGCAFCAIGANQGKQVSSRSAASLLREAETIVAHPRFRGTIQDLGGPTANMYDAACARREPCDHPSCLWPKRCPHLEADQAPYLELLRTIRALPGVRHLFVTTGLRTDLAISSPEFVRELALLHTSGQMKVAPEHCVPGVLEVMRKPKVETCEEFLELHRRFSREAKREQYVLPYLLAAHPGSAMADMAAVREWLIKWDLKAEQCQIFTPTPGTAATVMYATGINPVTMKPVFVERDPERKQLQKALILYHLPENAQRVRHALQLVAQEKADAAKAKEKHIGIRRVVRPGKTST